jgi:hypothetical protein
VIGRINKLRLYRMCDRITDDGNAPGIFKTGHHAPVVHFASTVMGIVAGIKENTHGTVLL